MADEKKTLSWDAEGPPQPGPSRPVAGPPVPAPARKAEPMAQPARAAPAPPPQPIQRQPVGRPMSNAPPAPPRQVQQQPQPRAAAANPPPPPARPAASRPPAAASRPPPDNAHLYTPPSYRPSTPGTASGPSTAAPRPAPAPPTRFASSVDEWQRGRSAEKAQAEADEEALLRELERKPAPQPEQAPGPGLERPPSRRRINQWPVARAVTIIIIVTVVLAALQIHGELGGARDFLNQDLSKGLPIYRVYPQSSEFNLKRILSTTCRGSELSYTVDVAIPGNLAGQQEMLEVSQTPTPTRTAGGYWNWSGTIHNGQKIAITISYHAKSYYYQWDIHAKDSGATSDVPASYSQYLGDSWKFTPSAPAIKSLAAQLAGDTTNVMDKVLRIYNYTHSNIAYLSNSPNEPKSPLQTLADRNGDCDDQSFFMGSLLRAEGVPAWMELGILYDQSTQQWGGHAWLDVFIPLKGSAGQVVNIDPANNEFLFRDSYRMTDYVDDGNSVHLQNYYILWRYTFVGTAPIREDAYDSIYFRASQETVGVRGSGPSLTDATPAKLWKAPGFEGVILLPAVIVTVVILGTLRRRAPGL